MKPPANPLARRFRTVRFKLLLVGEIAIVLGIAVLWLPVREEIRQQIVRSTQQQLQAIAATAALRVDGDLHSRIRDEGDLPSSAFRSLREQLREVAAANPDLHPEHIYTFRRQGDAVGFVVFTHDDDTSYRPRIGESYPLQPGMLSVFEEGRQVVRDRYTDIHGEWISAYAPILDSAGRVTGLLEVDLASEEYFRRFDAMSRVMIVVAVLTVAFSTVLGWLVLAHLVIRPLGAIHHGMAALSRQDFSHRVRLNTGDEFQELGETVNSLSESLNAARIVQTRFSPREIPDQERYRVASAWVPCEATAGDYFDVISLPGDRLALVIADVSGHGLGPSLLMSSCRSALRALATVDLEPQELVARLESQIQADLDTPHFITLLYGILEPDGTFRYCNAGHGPALARIGTEVVELGSHRIPLGMGLPVDPSRPLQSSVRLGVGDLVFLASDGLTEAIDVEGGFFGDERVHRVTASPRATSTEIIERLCREVDEHVGGRAHTDDLTMLCVQRNV
jgi:serine phosphatase RsbU (regulator of sigma subunit)